MTDGPQPEFLQPRVRRDGSIRLAESDPDWPVQYERHEHRIRAALGARAVQVEHVGSTSVPGLAAKPVIDILLVVANSADEAGFVPDLESAGYVLHLREPEWHEHRLLHDRLDPSPRQNGVHLHVFSVGCPEVSRMLAFRDRLRTHPAERDRYERTKRELAARHWDYVQDYADAKSTIVEEIVARALAG